ncbi:MULTISPECIES: DUF397 domain-containing protein [Actinomadura]|uniref:DUF397 domain-containing protein n=1 Tax=Actinomadura yumaensis TaxID=111807 RepID=A0ABW2CZ08_9ACTN|nr:DUF397 domain-containing protein [Actinomadura sp. J1-007]MWK37999.1 DUF397 domain-containing protein [Actinomadura sp. J1-007]
MMSLDWRAMAWKKSTYSPDWDDCVELSATSRVVGVRDSKDPYGPVLELGRRTAVVLVSEVKRGALDL